MRTMSRISLLILAGTLGASPVRAQVVRKDALTLEGARKVIAAAQAEAKAKGAPGGVIAVVDDGGNLMALERLDGTFAAGANISIGKARTAVIFKRPTKFFEDLIKNGRTAMTALPDFTPLQGGVPINLNGQVVGGVGVSGAASAQQDEELALAGAAAIAEPSSQGAGGAAGAAAPVAYFSKDQVSAAFARGAVLVDGTGRNYMIHASRREQAGLAEVHEKDTDLIYVTGGSATIVTGGSLVDAKPVDTGEIRGASIQGGESRHLARGDVLTVPSGTPHWFKEVDAPFTYYVVKVR